MTAVMACRKRLDWFPSAHQFEVEYQDAAGRRHEAERQAQRELLEAQAAPADSAVVKHHMAEIRQKLAAARGPLAASLREEFDR
jgi:hypothetical protein